jgi:hypothetical protein
MINNFTNINKTNNHVSCLITEYNKMAWDRYKHVVGLNRFMGSQPSPLDNSIYDGDAHIIKNDIKPAQNVDKQ